jgi:hypothetical protein
MYHTIFSILLNLNNIKLNSYYHEDKHKQLRPMACFALEDIGHVWFVANYATLCLRLVVRIEELTLGRKVRQSVAS